MTGPASWPTRTHVWAHPVDAEHLRAVRDDAARLGGDLTHLVLEVVAYAAEEAEALGRVGRCAVVVHDDGSVAVSDDGRGTETRRDDAGRVVRKPVMATRDVRFFGTDAVRLADGRPRQGMSVVAALSTWLRHSNHRAEGSWTQEYRHGLPVDELTEVPPTGRTGTAVRFLPDPALVPDLRLDEALLADPWLEVRVRRSGPS